MVLGDALPNVLREPGIFLRWVALRDFVQDDQVLLFVSINGQPITTEAQFMQFLTGPNLGTQALPLIVLRNGQQQERSAQNDG